jgi:hypothetical protein
MKAAFIGIDVACAKGKRLPIVVCRQVDGRLVPFALRDLEGLLSPPTGEGNVATLEPATRFALRAEDR